MRLSFSIALQKYRISAIDQNATIDVDCILATVVAASVPKNITATTTVTGTSSPHNAFVRIMDTIIINIRLSEAD